MTATAAHAQVSVDLNALNPPPAAAKPSPVRHTAARKPAIARPAPPVVAAPAVVARPALPTGTPPDVRLAPAPPSHAEAAVTAPRPAAPPPSGSVRAEAGPKTMRLVFAPGIAALPDDAAAAVKVFAADAGPGTFDVRAYATGPADDPSTPRRLSLSRATAVYEVLREAGVPSPRIFVRALGTAPTPDDAAAAPDRVDLLAHPAPPPPAEPAPAAKRP